MDRQQTVEDAMEIAHEKGYRGQAQTEYAKWLVWTMLALRERVIAAQTLQRRRERMLPLIIRDW